MAQYLLGLFTEAVMAFSSVPIAMDTGVVYTSDRIDERFLALQFGQGTRVRSSYQYR